MTATDKNIDPVMIDLPMPIVTPRLILRAPQPGDGAEVYAAKAETWDDLTRWMLWTSEGLGTAETAEKRACESHAKFQLREDLMIVGVERTTGHIVLWTGLHDINWQAKLFATGYWVRKSAQGQGYAAEGGNAILRYAFNVLGAQRVEICHAEGNDASRRVIGKLGYTKEGVHRRASALPDGSLADRHVYARLDLAGLPPLDVRWGVP